MSHGNKPKKITINVSATTAIPHPPGLSDGTLSLPIGGPGDAEFTTDVVKGQPVQFVGTENATITKITEDVDLFSTNPTPANKFTGIVGSLPENETKEYTLFYTVAGHPGITYKQDPKIRGKSST
ncbi:hypothetical protein [uncultured Eudoraea sp.]|uniref:hypothetical protein n=1 Tax=uncultured Eudoraea sp. TaxID=1035614 RepID=UPI00261D676B|nr:hypothetical protein [uncultured Eudoraea sp.]